MNNIVRPQVISSINKLWDFGSLYHSYKNSFMFLYRFLSIFSWKTWNFCDQGNLYISQSVRKVVRQDSLLLKMFAITVYYRLTHSFSMFKLLPPNFKASSAFRYGCETILSLISHAWIALPSIIASATTILNMGQFSMSWIIKFAFDIRAATSRHMSVHASLTGTILFSVTSHVLMIFALMRII